MLSKALRILNFDDSVTCQSKFHGAQPASVIDLTAIGSSARMWAKRAQADTIRASLDPTMKNAITFLGSGDYHYVSSLLLEQFNDTLTLIVFDHHPDWDILPPKHGCGAWVSRAIERPSVKQVILIGIDSHDLVFPAIITGNVRSAQRGRVVLLPFSRPKGPPWPWKKLPTRELKNDPRGVFLETLKTIKTDKIYVSIDKDCLTAAHALTNWEEGRLSLDLLLFYLQTLRQNYDIIGLDITGEYSAGTITSAWKAFCSKIDHPKKFSAAGHSFEEITRINGGANEKITRELIS